MKIRGDGRLGGISEVLGNRKWKEPRPWSSKWVTTGHGKVDKVKVVTEQRPRIGRPLVGTGGSMERGPEPRTKLLSEFGACVYVEEWTGGQEMWRWRYSEKKRIPSWSHGWDSALSLLRASVPSLVGELRFYKPHGVAKKQTKLWNDPWRMRVMGKWEELTSQGGRASRQREGPKPGPRSQQEHGVFWNSEPGIRETSQTTTDYTMGSVLILKEMVTCSFILFVPSTHNIGCLRANLEICYSPVLCSLVTSSILTAGNSQNFISRFSLCTAAK